MNLKKLHEDKNNPYEILQKHLEIFGEIFKSHREGVLIADLSGTIVYYNKSQSKIDGIKPVEALNKTIREVYNIASKCSPTMQVIRTGKPAFDDVHFYRTRSGNLINSACHIYPLFLEGAFCGALSFISEYSFLEAEALDAPEKEPKMAPNIVANTVKNAVFHKKKTYKFSNIIGKSKLLVEAVKTSKLASNTPSPVMLIGETGVGKEMFARSIHSDSQRRDKAFTAINCAAVPETLLEGILFGTSKGAFTGAVDRAGLLESSDGGTVFLDEVDSMPLAVQSKLLRVLQDFSVRRVGDIKEHAIDLKIISAVGRSPKECLEEGLLRKDLYFRLGVVQVAIPPLRKRLEDIPLLVQGFIKKHSQILNISTPLISPELMALFYSYHWPGNVRELEHIIEAGLNILEGEASLTQEHIRKISPSLSSSSYAESPNPEREDQMPLSVRCSHYKCSSCYQTEAAILCEDCQPDEDFYRRDGLKVSSSQATEEAFSMKDNSLKKGLDGLKLLSLKNYQKKTDPYCETSINKDAGSKNIGSFYSEAKDFEKEIPEARRLDLLESTDDFEINKICSALKRCSGNQSMAARLLGISPQLMYYKVKRFNINVKKYVPTY